MFVDMSNVYVIAEVAESHYGDFERAINMIEKAHVAGASAVKFQHHIPSEEMLRDVPLSSNMREPLYDFLERTAFGIKGHVRLKKYCDEIGIDYLCTPFSLRAAQELEEHVNPTAYKIGSGELTDLPTLAEIAKFGKPMIVSTGMSEIVEIDETYNFLIGEVPELILLNCTSAYPPSEKDINLGFIPKMIERYPAAVIGHSDHTPGIYTALGAVAMGARVLEKHITIDHELQGPDEDVSISYDDLASLVEGAKIISNSLGSQKMLLNSEREIQAWARRSLVYTRDLKAGSILTEHDIWGKRPGTGVPSKYYWEFLGKTLKTDVVRNSLLSKEDFE